MGEEGVATRKEAVMGKGTEVVAGREDMIEAERDAVDTSIEMVIWNSRGRFGCRKDVTMNPSETLLSLPTHQLRPFPCELCRVRSANKRTLVRHKGQAHDQVDMRNNARYQSVKEHVCSMCPKSYCSMYRLSEHLSVCSGSAFLANNSAPAIKTEVATLGLSSSVLVAARTYMVASATVASWVKGLEDTEPLNCHFCGKNSRNKRSLVVHVNRYHTDRLTEHFISDEGSNASSKIISKAETVQMEDCLLVCELCSKAFHTQIGLDRHRTSHMSKREREAETIIFLWPELPRAKCRKVVVGKGGERKEGGKGKNCSLPTARQVTDEVMSEGGRLGMPLPDTLVLRREAEFELRDEFYPELPRVKCREAIGPEGKRKLRSHQEVEATRGRVGRSLEEVRKGRREETWRKEDCLEVAGSVCPSSEMWVEATEEEQDKGVGEEQGKGVGEQPPNTSTSEISPIGLEDGNRKTGVKVKNLRIAEEIGMIDLAAIGVKEMASLHRAVEVPSWREDVKHYALLKANGSNHKKSEEEAECSEDMGDETYLGRHNKHEKAENLEKFRHKQKLRREEKELQKLLAQQKQQGVAKNRDRGRTLLPVLEEATHITVEDTVPVSVFGRSLPDMKSSCFSLPWI